MIDITTKTKFDRKEYMRNWWLKNKDKKRNYDKTYREKHPELKVKKAAYHHKHRRHYSRLHKAWVQLHPNWRRLRNQKIRQKILLKLGNKCANPFNLFHPDWCNDIRCLQIDHINGKGTNERKNEEIFYVSLLLGNPYGLRFAFGKNLKRYYRLRI